MNDDRSAASHLAQYRAALVQLEERSQAAFDKTLLTLSGGALGVSFAFVSRFLGDRLAVALGWLVGAWGCWIVSLGVVLCSHYFSTLAVRQAIKRVDAGHSPGRFLDRLVAVLNAAGGVLFLVGLLAVAVFVKSNLE